MGILTKLMTLVSVATLALAVLWHSAPDYRMLVCVVVSVGGITLAIRSLLAGKLVWAIVFLAVLGVFTPLRSAQFSHSLMATLDMVTLALFAISPLLLRKARTVPSAPHRSPGAVRRFH
jgi:hypothetical protein